MKRLLALLLLSALIALPTAAWAEEARSITLNQKSLVLAPGATYKLRATVEPESDVSWSSSDEAVATVNDKTGRVTAVAEGTATIAARTDDGEEASCDVVVRAIGITSIKLNRATATLGPGVRLQLVATWKPQNATAVDIAWHSSIPSVASVDQKGQVMTLKAGTTLITATAPSGKKASCRVTVRNILATSVKLNRDVVSLTLGDTVQLIATVRPDNATNKELAWTSSHEEVATVTQDGLVTTVGEGKTTIIAKTKDGSYRKGTCTVKSNAVRVASFTLSASTRVFDIGETYQMKHTILPKNASFQDVRWSIADDTIATVDKQGLVTALSSGVTTLTAKTDGNRKTATCSIRVRSATPVEITISGVGDMTLGGDPRRGTFERFAQWMSKYNNDYSKPLERVQSVLAADDLTIGNLECALTTVTRHWNKKYVFKGKPAYVNILTQGSVEVVNLANNHSTSFREEGYLETKRVLKKAKVGYCGMEEEYVVDIKGVKVGFCGFRSPTSLSNIVHRCKGMRKRCDIVVASFHWGDVPQHTYTTMTRQRKCARLAVTSGADLVLGHHTHVIAGIELFEGKYIVYGLGNFIIPSNKGSDFDTMIFQQTIKVHDGFCEDGGIKVIPCSFRDQDENRLQPRILEGAEARRVLDKIRHYSQEFPDPAVF